MRKPANFLHVDDRPQSVRCQRAGNQPGARTEQGREIVGMERTVLAHFPPADLRPMFLEHQPGRDVGFMIYVGDNNLRPVTQDLRDALAHDADERSGIHAKRDFVG
jgi:hypothetical protein